MNNSEPNFITFELSADSSTLFIFGDTGGLERLRETLERLIEKTKSGSFDHTHLMSSAWGGNELSNVAEGADTKLMNHVKVYCLKGDTCQID